MRKRVFGLLFCLLGACTSGDRPVTFASLTERDSLFFQLRMEKDSDRKEVLQQSHMIYSESEVCSEDIQCRGICNRLFSFDWEKQDCKALPIPQVQQLKRVIDQFHEKQMSSLKEVDFFDLKVLLNLSPQSVVKILDTLGFAYGRDFLNWIASDWQVAQVFYSEDWDFLFFEVFLKEVGISPISSLGEEVNGRRTFAERAWLAHNDFALFWMDDYFKNVLCFNVEEKKINNCMLAQYCLLSESFKDDLLEEIVDFQNKQIFEKRSQSSVINLKNLCLDFCSSSEDGQTFCSSAKAKVF